MCLIAFSWQPGSAEPLRLAANRDEFYARPTLPMHWWADAPLLAGRDLQEGGTWLGIARDGRFAALTNVRDPSRQRSGAPSRGRLPLGYLREPGLAPARFIDRLQATAADYNGFNLLLGDLRRSELWWFSNHAPRDTRRLGPGVYGLSNALLDTPWPKVERVRHALHTAADDDDALLQAMLDAQPAPDEALPSTGVSRDWERLLSAPFIRSTHYGTRSTTLLRLGVGEARVVEHTHAHAGQRGDVGAFRFAWGAAVQDQ
jgi:uncharacterized protein with NRDE domain